MGKIIYRFPPIPWEMLADEFIEDPSMMKLIKWIFKRISTEKTRIPLKRSGKFLDLEPFEFIFGRKKCADEIKIGHKKVQIRMDQLVGLHYVQKVVSKSVSTFTVYRLVSTSFSKNDGQQAGQQVGQQHGQQVGHKQEQENKDIKKQETTSPYPLRKSNITDNSGPGKICPDVVVSAVVDVSLYKFLDYVVDPQLKSPLSEARKQSLRRAPVEQVKLALQFANDSWETWKNGWLGAVNYSLKKQREGELAPLSKNMQNQQNKTNKETNIQQVRDYWLECSQTVDKSLFGRTEDGEYLTIGPNDEIKIYYYENSQVFKQQLASGCYKFDIYPNRELCPSGNSTHPPTEADSYE